MSHNPNTVKSQHELTNESGRKSDVLIHTLEELEKTKKQLEIAKEALHLYKNLRGDGTLTNYQSIAINALEEIGCLELDYMEKENA